VLFRSRGTWSLALTDQETFKQLAQKQQ